MWFIECIFLAINSLSALSFLTRYPLFFLPIMRITFFFVRLAAKVYHFLTRYPKVMSVDHFVRKCLHGLDKWRAPSFTAWKLYHETFLLSVPRLSTLLSNPSSNSTKSYEAPTSTFEFQTSHANNLHLPIEHLILLENSVGGGGVY